MKQNIKELKRIANSSEESNKIFAFFSTRKNHNPITVEKFITVTRHKMERTEIVQLLKILENYGLGSFIAGRYTYPSRFFFIYTPESIGSVALSQATELKKVWPDFLVASAAS